MESYEKPIHYDDLNKNQGSFDRATNEFIYEENKAASFEPQIAFPNQPLTVDTYFGYIKVEITRFIMFSTAMRYLVLFKIFITLLYLTCIDLYLVVFIPVVILDIIGYCSSKSLNQCRSIVYLVFLILSLCAKVLGIVFIIFAYILYDKLYKECWDDENYSDYCSYYGYMRILLIHLLIALFLILIYETFQIILQFKFVRALKNLTEVSRKDVLEMIYSKDTSFCFC